jgi:hypothetical protein
MSIRLEIHRPFQPISMTGVLTAQNRSDRELLNEMQYS